jgi:hypothetical protein
MADEEENDHLIAEKDMTRNMNASPEEFIEYIRKHNLWISKENFPNFQSMHRFKSFSNCARKCRNNLNVKIYLPEDNRIKTETTKKDDMKSIAICTNVNVNIEKKQEQIQITKPDAIRIKVNRPTRKAIEICRSNEKKKLVIVTKKQEKLEIVRHQNQSNLARTRI